MDWDTYRDHYRTFDHSINQTLVLTQIADRTLGEWPKGLPESIREPLQRAQREYAELASAMLDEKISVEEFEARRAQLYEEWDRAGGRELYGSAIRLYLSRPATAPKEIDFRRIVVSQGLVMTFAHLDAFLADSMRAICRVRVDVLKSGKQMKWNEIIEAGGWDPLLNRMIEQQVFEFGWPPVRDRIGFLKERIGLEIAVSGDDLDFIARGEAMRDVIVHNGGNVSQVYLDRTKRTDVKIGDLLQLSIADVSTAVSKAHVIGRAVAEAIAEKFYQKLPILL